jgi:hypothetical protein
MFVVDGGAGGVLESLRPDAAHLLQDQRTFIRMLESPATQPTFGSNFKLLEVKNAARPSFKTIENPASSGE